MNAVIEHMLTRRSIRKYQSRAVPGELMDQVILAGTYAASGKGHQAGIIVAITDRELRDRLSEMNRKIGGWEEGFDPFYGAPTVVVVLADGETPNWLQDGSLVMGNLMTAAWALGVGSCWINRAMELFDRPEGKELLKKWGLPETYRGVGNCILGYIDGDVPAPKPRKEHYIYLP